jgi:hypothetical protein
VPANWVGAAGGTVIALEPTGRISDERLVQLDFQVSKTFRFGGTTVRPTFEVFNVLNADNVQGRTSEEVINAAGTYMQPSSMLQGRIIGFSVNREW